MAHLAQLFSVSLIVLVAAWAFWRWYYHRGAARRWFLFTILSLAVALLLDEFFARDLLSDLGRISLTLEFVVLALIPYCLYRFTSCFTPQRTIVEVCASGSMTVIILLTAWIPTEYFTQGYHAPSWFSFYLVGYFFYWIALSLLVATQLWLGGRGQPTVIRYRMRTLAIGVIGTVSSLIARLIVVKSGSESAIFIEAIQLVSLSLLALGYDPPSIVRTIWRSSESNQTRDAAIALLHNESELEAGEALLPRAISSLGAYAGAWYDENGDLLLQQGEVPDKLPMRNESPVTGRSFRRRRVAATRVVDQERIDRMRTTDDAIPGWRRMLPKVRRPERIQPASDITLVDDQVRLQIKRGTLVFWVSSYTPFFGYQELQVLQSIGALFDIAGEREEALGERNLLMQAQTTAQILAASVLPTTLPDIPGIELAARYQPANAADGVGGDWYDVFELSPRKILLVVGDVMGKGVQAASVMAQLRNGLRAYMLEGYGPAEALTKLNYLSMRSHPETMATIWIGLWDADNAQLTTASAGHLPPIVRDNEAHVLKLTSGVPIGVSELPEYTDAVVDLSAGSALLAYSDGLVERRGESLELGLARACDWWQADDSLQQQADHILQCAQDDGAGGDDIALLLFQPPTVDDLTIRTPATPDQLGRHRELLRAWLQTHLDAEEKKTVVWNIIFVTGEALANAVEHAYTGRQGMVELRAFWHEDVLLVEIQDWGGWRPKQDRDRGRGMQLMEQLSDSFEVISDGGTIIRLRWEGEGL